MNATSPVMEDESPDFPDFPDPRKTVAVKKPAGNLSIDAILRRTHPSLRQSNNLVEIGIQDRIERLEETESSIKEKERDLARLSAEIWERERVVRETEILLEARERLLDDREILLSNRQKDLPGDQNVQALEKSLHDTREALTIANEALAEKETFIKKLQADLEDLKASRLQAGPAGDSSSPTSFDQIAHPSLADQVAFLREREAFIEQSENTLFDKAQALQEWETRLQQEEHDQSSANSSEKNPPESSPPFNQTAS